MRVLLLHLSYWCRKWGGSECKDCCRGVYGDDILWSIWIIVRIHGNLARAFTNGGVDISCIHGEIFGGLCQGLHQRSPPEAHPR